MAFYIIIFYIVPFFGTVGINGLRPNLFKKAKKCHSVKPKFSRPMPPRKPNLTYLVLRKAKWQPL